MGYPARKMIFQSTLPRGERHHLRGAGSSQCGFQPTLREGTEGAKAYYNVAIISTHAPTGGATTLKALCTFCALFQSTLHGGRQCVYVNRCDTRQSTRSHGGSDNFYGGRYPDRKYFNPRSHGGSDGNYTYVPAGSKEFQSTLPRGKRPKRSLIFNELNKFQSTLPRGERRCVTRVYTRFSEFQSTLPRERQQLRHKFIWVWDFNPRSHGGSDSKSHQI